MLSLHHNEKTSFSMVKKCLWGFGSHFPEQKVEGNERRKGEVVSVASC